MRRKMMRRAHPRRSLRNVGIFWTEGFLKLDAAVLGGTWAVLLPALSFIDRLTPRVAERTLFRRHIWHVGYLWERA